MSACRDIAPLITADIDRELAEEKRDDVDRHVAAWPPAGFGFYKNRARVSWCEVRPLVSRRHLSL
jgi:hypothetical protein